MVMNIKNLQNNLILDTDSYKLSQYVQYPPSTEYVFSYIESRGCNFSKEVVVLGVQYFIKKYLSKPVTQEDIDNAKEFANKHGMIFNESGWQYIVDHYNGVLPLKIRAVPEGTIIPVKNIMASVINTDIKCYWLTSYIETALLRCVWYASTVASNSLHTIQTIKKYLDMTSDDPLTELPFKLHDFGARGVSSKESAGLGGMAHLVNSSGTDTITGILYAMEYYGSDVCGFSIGASEHSTHISWMKENERKSYKNMVDKFAKDGAIFAVVSDSYDIYNAVDNMWGDGLLEQVKERNATVVIRPDSGDPCVVPVKIIKQLMKIVGYTKNSKGYKVLPDYVRVIQGDGINRESVETILSNMEKEGLSASNIAFGMGGGLLQQVNRDDFKFAMKASAVRVANEWRDVFKSPIDDKGKESKKGRLVLIKDNATGKYRTINFHEPITSTEENVMVTVYNNGIVKENMSTFDEVRARASSWKN